MDHGALTKNLYDFVVSVPEFQNITGVTLGQHEPDPTLVKLTPPACWVSFVGDQINEQGHDQVPLQPSMLYMFVAFIYLPMQKQNNLLTTASGLPLLGKISMGVHGKESNTGHRWEYKGQKLSLVNTDRLVYAQRYSVVGSL